MKLTPLQYHEHHEMRIHLNKIGSAHFAALRCVECNKHIQWLTPLSTQRLVDLGVDLQDSHKSRQVIDSNV
jgi:hypothetical protein